jgi:hypothetical protein
MLKEMSMTSPTPPLDVDFDKDIIVTPRSAAPKSVPSVDFNKEITITPREITVTPRKPQAAVATTEDEPTGRPSNPYKQTVAGVTDVFTGIPAVAGYVGAGVEAGFNRLTDGTNRTIGEQWDAASASGIDADLMAASAKAREFVNDTLKIKEPVSTEDQIGRILGAFAVPIPGSASVKLGNKALSFVLPLVRTGKGFGKRVAQQAVIGGTVGTAIDQGARAYNGAPMMFSEQALTGDAPDDITITPRSKEGALKLHDLDAKVQEAQDREDSISWATHGAVLLGVSILARRPILNAVKKIRDPKAMGNQLHEDFMDSSTALETEMRNNIGLSDDAISHVIHNSHSDARDMANHWLDFGELGQDFSFPSRLIPKSFDQLNEKLMSMTAEQQQKFTDAMTASVDKIERAKGKATDLWANTKKTDTDLDKIIKAGMDDDKIKDLMVSMGQQYELMLRYQVHRGRYTMKQAGELLHKARIDGRLAYMPIYKPDPRGFFTRLADKYLSIGGKARSEASYLGEFAPSDPMSQGAHLSPLDAYRKYAIHTIADANEQSFKAGILDSLAGIKRVNGIAKPFVRGTPTARDTTFIGTVKDLSNKESLVVSKVANPYKEFHGNTVADLEIANPGEIRIVHANDELRIYHVPDRGLRAALDLNPRLSNLLQTASAWKNVFSKGTTGSWSVFAPLSHLYGAAQTALTTTGREGLWKGVKSIGQGLSATGHLMAIDGAKNISTFLGQRIARHMRSTGEAGNIAAPMMSGLQKRLDARIKNTMLNMIRRESGRTQTGLGNVGNGTMQEIMAAVGRNSSDYFGKDQMGLIGNLWQTWNNAWHEGPALGATLRHIGEVRNAGKAITPQVIRDATDVGKTIAGDMRRIGASKFAEAFNASVPFSGAMLQSWNALGSAAKHDFGKFMLGASALIGVPTLTELAWNKSVGASGQLWKDSEGHEWTYDDYYWNGYNTHQRIDNFIYFIPGKPPWEAILIPVSPEWSLFRGITIEAADALFDLSNIGAMANVDQSKTNRSHFWTAVARITDVPLPPFISAVLSAFGADVQLGLRSTVNNAAGEAPEESMSFLRNIPIGQGDRYGRATKFDSGHLTETVSAMIQDIFGAAGAAYINIHEAFMTGLTRKDGSVAEAVDRSLEAFGDSAKSQMRYLQPLLGKAVHANSSNDEITKAYIASKKAMQNLARQVEGQYMQGGKVYANGKLVSGDTIIPRDDPVNAQMAGYARDLLKHISMIDKEVNQLHRDIKTIPNARNIGSIKERNDKRDALTLELQAKRATALGIIHDAELKISHYLTTIYNRKIDIRFSEFSPRAQLPTSSIFEELQK